MSTFNLALFLPYTVDFRTTAGSRRPSAPATPRSQKPTSYFPSPPTGGLLGSPASPQSPESTTSQRPVFTPLDPSSPALHFASPHNPRSVARTDSHIPEWGRGRVFNQPQSRAGQAPPSTILQYGKTFEQAKHEKPKARPIELLSPRSMSNDKKFSLGSFTIEPAFHGNGGLINAVRAISEAEDEARIWVGTLGFPTDALDENKKADIEDDLENEYQSLTVFVSDSDFDGHYNHYCKTMLWPVFHYVIPDHPKSKAFEDHSWKYYVKVNQAFADRVVKSYKHGDIIWVHDYHLLLVPRMIREKLPDARIGFFLHAAFPSSEVFRCLACRRQLLEGMLGANLIAFQAKEYANHFLQSCSRLLVVEVTSNGVLLEDHFVDVIDCPIGIVPEQLNEIRRTDEVKAWTKILRDKYGDKFLIVARDKLDNIRGIKQKLLAYEMFLEKYPKYSEKVVLIQVATSTMHEQKDLAGTVSDIVTRVNSKHSTLAHQPLVFLKQDIAFPQYLAMLTAADALMITSLRDGMNLTCHEFILCQDGAAGGKKHAPLILSEFTGSSALFDGLDLSVNPWDTLQMVKAIKHAVEMSNEERDIRYAALYKTIMQHSGIEWIKSLDRRLEEAYEGHQLRDTMSVPRLSIPVLSEQYKTSTNRLFFLDYEGTLATLRTDYTSASPQRVMDVLGELLASSDRNVVYVTSSRTPQELERIFSSVPGLGLVAENGCFVRLFDQDQWMDLTEKFVSPEWKDGVMNILLYYRDRIEGSWIEERNCGFVLHYEGVADGDTDAAERQAGDCVNHINESCVSQRVKAVPGDHKVIIEPSDVSKATAARWILHSVQDPRLELPEIADLSLSDVASNYGSSAAMSRKASFGDNHSGSDRGSDSGDATPHEPVSRRPRKSTMSSVASRRSHGYKENDSETPNSPTIQSLGQPSPALSASPSDGIRGYHTTPDFLMVAGDDREDEALFRWVNKLGKAYTSGRGGVKHTITVCVGKRNTEASATLTQGITGLLTALHKLSKAESVA